MTSLPPGLLMILAAAALPFVPNVARQMVMLGAIALSAYGLMLGAGIHLVWDVLGFELVLYRADALSFPFAVIFHIAANGKLNASARYNTCLLYTSPSPRD